MEKPYEITTLVKKTESKAIISHLAGILLFSTATVYVVWSVQRVAWRSEFDVSSAHELNVALTAPFIIAFIIISLAMAYRRTSGIEFVGYVSTISLIPAVPHFPFIRELGHIAIWVLIICYLRNLPLKHGLGCRLTRCLRHVDLPLIFLGAFIFAGIISLFFNFALGGSIFFLKVGISEVAVYLSLFGFLFIVTVDDEVRRAGYRLLMNALLVSAFVAIGLGVFGVFALFLSEVQPNNDTALGFGYYCRLKSSFFGPVHAGIFYSAIIPILLHHGSITTSRRMWVLLLIALVVDSVLIVATGSRTARLATVAVLAGGLLYRPYRRMCLYMLPFYGIVFYIGFFYRCIEAAIAAFISGVDHVYLYIRDGFFEDAIRRELLITGSERWLMLDSSGPSHTATGEQILRILLGIGPGVSGIASTGYEPHITILDILVEQGVIGFVFAAAMVFCVVYRLLLGFRQTSGALQSACLAALMALAVILAGGLTFETQTWVFVWYFLALGLMLARNVKTASQQ